MIRGIVTDQREAIIRLRILASTAQEQEIDAVVDTGFNDFLALPSDQIKTLDLPFAAPLLATLADGTVVETNSYRAAVMWDSQRRDVLVVACDGGPLVGMSMLYGCNLFLEAKDGGAVIIERQAE